MKGNIAAFGLVAGAEMNWWFILNMAAIGGAFAAMVVAMLLIYRSASTPMNGEADLQRQSDFATYAGFAGALAAVAFLVGLLAL